MSRSKWIKRNGIKVWRATVERCNCGGYHFPHRIGSGACHKSLYADYYASKRAGESEPDSMALLSANAIERKFPLK